VFGIFKGFSGNMNEFDPEMLYQDIRSLAQEQDGLDIVFRQRTTTASALAD